MRVHFSYYISIVVLGSFLVSCGGLHHGGKDKKMPGTWQATPVVIDGKGDDWPSPYPSYDSKAFVGYATSNDRDNLYITLETGDEYAQMKILKQGLTVWIDTDGKKETGVGIHFPLTDDNDPLEGSSKERGSKGSGSDMHSRELSQKIKRGLSDATQMTIEGFKACSGGFLVTQKNPCGIVVRIGIDEYKELIWEAVIPIKAIYNKEHLDKRDDGKPISVCFSVKGFKKPSSGSSDGGNPAGANSMGTGGMRGGGGGGGMGGGGGHGKGMHGGAPRGGASNPRDQLFESTRTWKQFGLVYQ